MWTELHCNAQTENLLIDSSAVFVFVLRRHHHITHWHLPTAVTQHPLPNPAGTHWRKHSPLPLSHRYHLLHKQQTELRSVSLSLCESQLAMRHYSPVNSSRSAQLFTSQWLRQAQAAAAAVSHGAFNRKQPSWAPRWINVSQPELNQTADTQHWAMINMFAW